MNQNDTDFKKWFYSTYNIDNTSNYKKFYNIYDVHNEINTWLNDIVVITNDKKDFIKIKDIYKLYKENTIYTKLSKRKKRQNNFKNFTYDIIANSIQWSKYFAKNRIKKTAAVRLVGVKFRNEVL